MRRLAVAGSAIVLVSALFAACGGASTSPAAAAVREAPKKTTDARTSRMDVAIDRPPAAGQASSVLHMSGEVDFAGRRSHMVIDLSQLGLPGGPVDTVYDNTVVYTKLPPALVPGLPAGKQWIKVDLATAGQSVGAGTLSQAQSGDPGQALNYLTGTSGTVTRVGDEDVRATPTTHYKTVVDLNKAADRSPGSAQAIKATVKLLGTSKLPTDVWIDAQGRLRQLRYTADLTRSKATSTSVGVPSSLTVTLNLFDFGVPVQVAVPPADQVVDLNTITGPGK